MSTYFNESCFKKAFILHFQSISSNENDYISFSIPPQTIGYKLPQRVSETKTFGGMVYDYYGNDTITISLAGTTTNNELRVIQTGAATTDHITGDEEISRITELVHKYGKIENLKQQSVTLYNDSSSYNVLIKDFEIKRSKDKPFSWDYQLELIVLPEFSLYNADYSFDYEDLALNETDLAGLSSSDLEKIGLSDNSVLASFKTGESSSSTTLSSSTTKSPALTCLKVLSCSCKISAKATRLKNYIEETTPSIKNTYQNFYQKILTITSDIENKITLGTNVVENIFNFPETFISDTLSLVDQVSTSVVRATVGTVSNLMNDANRLTQAIKDVKDEITDWINGDNAAAVLSRQLYDSITDTVEDIKDTWCGMFSAMEDDADNLVIAVKDGSTNDGVVIPGDETTSDEIIKVYGYKQYYVQSGDTWDSIAFRFYGDASKGVIVASYNNTVMTLEAGTLIWIPILDSVSDNSVPEIYNEPGIKDNSGTDIKISSNGKIDFSSGDFVLVGGQDNINQAITNRLSTEMDSRVRVVAYGIKSAVGSVNIPKGLVISSIKTTLLRDPRVKTVDGISYEGEGDKLHLTINYTTINDYKKTFKGVI